jgi:hypothetical protein
MQQNQNPRCLLKLLPGSVVLLPALIAAAAWLPFDHVEAQNYSFGTQIQSTNTASITYNSATGTFEYTDNANPTADTASIPLIGSAASLITASGGWHASITINVSPKTMTATSSASPNDGIGLSAVYVSGETEHFVSIVAGQVNNTGNAGLNYPKFEYGTGAHFLARFDGGILDTTPLGASVYVNGDSLLVLTGGTNASAVTESVEANIGVVTLSYDALTKTMTGYYDGMPVGSYSIAGWAANPSLTLYVFGSSGAGIAVPALSDTATNFNASSERFSLPQLGATPAVSNLVLSWPTNATGFALQSTANLLPPAVWTTVSAAPVIVSTNYMLTIPSSGSQRFFRLEQN